jgi:hypothetical protein
LSVNESTCQNSPGGTYFLCQATELGHTIAITMHSNTPESFALSDIPPRRREDLIRECINGAYLDLDQKDKVIIDREVDSIKIICTGTNLGPAGALELLAKLGMFLNKTDEPE